MTLLYPADPGVVGSRDELGSLALHGIVAGWPLPQVMDLDSGVEALTASERRVAEIAAAGLVKSRDSLGAVRHTPHHRGHLTHAYAKLSIFSRSELPTALVGSHGGLSQTAPRP